MWALEPLGMTICIYIYIDAAVMCALEPLGMTICIYIYIDAAVMCALEPLGMTICIYAYTYIYTSMAFQSAVRRIKINYLSKADVATILASRKTSSDYMINKNIIPNFSWL